MMRLLVNICAFGAAAQQGYLYARFQQDEWNCFQNVNGSQYDYECVDGFGDPLLCPVGMYKYEGDMSQSPFLAVTPCAQTEAPTKEPSLHPSRIPTIIPTINPTLNPTFDNGKIIRNQIFFENT